MSRREKTEFILEQVQLCIESGDWTQAGILSRKITATKYFARKPRQTPEEIEKARKEAEEKEKKRSVDEAPPEPEDDVTDLKLKYYEQQVTLSKHEDKYLDVCKHYRQVLDTELVEDDPKKLHAVCSAMLGVQVSRLTIPRFCNESAGILFLPNTTTNNPISSSASRPIRVTRNCHQRLNCSEYSRCRS